MDDAMWPLVVVTFSTSTSDDDWRRMFRVYERYYARGQRFHVVNDGLAVKGAIVPSQRKIIAESARAHEDMSRRWCLGGATVVGNTIARGVVTAITWVAPPAYKLTFHPTLADAADEAIRTLGKHGIAIPEVVKAYRRSLSTTAA